MHVIRTISHANATRAEFNYRPWILSGILFVLVLASL